MCSLVFGCARPFVRLLLPDESLKMVSGSSKTWNIYNCNNYLIKLYSTPYPAACRVGKLAEGEFEGNQRLPSSIMMVR